MKKISIKKIILVVIFVLILIISSIIIIKNTKKDKIDEVSPIVEQYKNENKGKLTKVDNLVDLYMVKNCIQKFYENLCAINYVDSYDSNNIESSTNTAIQIIDENNRNREYFQNVAYQCLASKYVEKTNINKENIATLNSKNFENIIVELYDVHSMSKFENTYAFFTNGIIRSSETNEGIDFNYIVVIDTANKTFEIYLDDYLEDNDFSNLNEGDEIDFELPNSVENRNYNTYGNVAVKYDKIVLDTFYNIRRLMLYDVDKAYSLLSDDIKQEFLTINDFEKFIDENKEEIFSLQFGSYKLKASDEGAAFVIYNSENTFRINVYFDSFSKYTFNIEKLN